MTFRAIFEEQTHLVPPKVQQFIVILIILMSFISVLGVLVVYQNRLFFKLLSAVRFVFCQADWTESFLSTAVQHFMTLINNFLRNFFSLRTS
jgi:hypothetical protein